MTNVLTSRKLSIDDGTRYGLIYGYELTLGAGGPIVGVAINDRSDLRIYVIDAVNQISLHSFVSFDIDEFCDLLCDLGYQISDDTKQDIADLIA
jgi:hypothetical protein